MIEQLSLGICGMLFLVSLGNSIITAKIGHDHERSVRWFVCAIICGLMTAVDLTLILGLFG